MPRDKMYDKSAIGRELNLTSVQVLKTDVETALTFVRIAKHAGTNTEKRNRNQANARKAYNSVSAYEKRLKLSDDEKRELSEKMKHLKSALTDLGEVF